MMVDFILTYIGISNGVIYEGNPVLVPVFEMSFISALLSRLRLLGLISAALISIVCLMEGKQVKIVNALMNFALILNGLLMCLHLRWIILSIIY